ncbi:hypothetical protein Tco_1191891 [Tanacetum coccineum]
MLLSRSHEEDPEGVEDDKTMVYDKEDEDEERKHLVRLTLTTVIHVDEPVFPPEGSETCYTTTPPLTLSMGLGLRPAQTFISLSTRGRGERLNRGKNYGFVRARRSHEKRRLGIRDVGYGIRGTWVDPAEVVPEIAPMTVGEVNTRVTELAELHEHDTQDLYALLGCSGL